MHTVAVAAYYCFGDDAFDNFFIKSHNHWRFTHSILYIVLLHACLPTLHSKIDPSELAAKGVLRSRRLCCLRRETAFCPESAAGSSEAGSYRSPLCTSSRNGADRRWGFGASL